MAMNRMDASWENLDSDTKIKAAGYFHRAVNEIDEQFGDGYAAKHSDLIAAFMQVCAADNTSTQAFIAAQEFGPKNALIEIAEAIDARAKLSTWN